MTVAELIEKLKEMPQDVQDAEVFLAQQLTTEEVAPAKYVRVKRFYDIDGFLMGVVVVLR